MKLIGFKFVLFVYILYTYVLAKCINLVETILTFLSAVGLNLSLYGRSDPGPQQIVMMYNLQGIWNSLNPIAPRKAKTP